MAEEIDLENGRISNFEGLVTLTLDRVILHNVVHQSSTSTYMPNFIQTEETFRGRTDVQTFETDFIKSTLSKSPPKNDNNSMYPVKHFVKHFNISVQYFY